jgi:hypothetical protein
MDVEPAWSADPEDLDEPEDEPEYWDAEELMLEELSAWQDAMEAAERADRARKSPGPDAAGQKVDGPEAWPRSEGNVPDLIAAVIGAAGDPALMTDADLVESLAGWHAVAARVAGRELRATEELLRRRRPRVWDRRADRTETRREEADGADTTQEQAPERAMPAVVPSREAAEEVALALTATEYAAQAQVQLAADLSRRLPAAFAELDAGRTDLYRIKVLAEGTQFLSDADAGRVDALLAPRLGQLTSGDLRDKVRKAVIRIDPAAADRRASHAARKARFAVYGNADQTATAAIERMPAHLGAAVRARVNAIARAAKAAGMTDPMPLLEAKVATGLLLDTLPDIPPPADEGPAGSSPEGGSPEGGSPEGGSPAEGPGGPGPAAGPWNDGWPADWFTTPDVPDTPDSGADRAPADRGPDDRRQADCDPRDPGDGQVEPANFGPGEPANFGPGEPGPAGGTEGAMCWPQIPEQAGRAGPGCWGLPAWLRPKNPGRIRLTVPWRTLTGIGREPGELSWIGPIIPAQARDLALAAAVDPACAWHLIITDDQGRAIAITTLRTRHSAGAGPPGLVSEVTLTIAESLAVGFDQDRQASDWISNALARLAVGHGHPAGGTTEANIAALADLLARAVPAATRAIAEAAERMAADAVADGCAHTMEARGYRVPDRLRRWLNTRDRTCRNPVCRRPAARCDQDHTLAYHHGGRTCPCNLGGLCRTHHQLKQLPGWRLTQDAQGYFTWRTPAGLTYRKEPFCYPV